MADEAVLKINIDERDYNEFVSKWQKFKKQQIREEKSKKGLTSTLTQGFSKVKSVTGSIVKNFQSMTTGIGGAVLGVFSFVKAITSAVRKNYELAQGVGTTTRNVEVMQEAFRKSGIGGDAGALLANMRNMQLDLTSQARPLLTRYGVEGKGDTQQQFLQLLEKIVNSYHNDTQKLRDLELLGLDRGSAQAMITNDGYKRFIESLKEAEGESEMNEGRAKRMKNFDEQVERLKKAFANLAQLASEQLLPYMDKFAKWLTQLVKTKGKDIIEGTIEALKTFGQFLKNFANWIMDSPVGAWIMGDEWAEKRKEDKLKSSQEYQEVKQAGLINDNMSQAEIQRIVNQYKGLKGMKQGNERAFQRTMERHRKRGDEEALAIGRAVENNIVINVANPQQASETVENISNSSISNPKRLQKTTGL